MASEKHDLIDRKDLIKAVERKQFAIANNTHPYEAIRIQGRYFREVVDNAPTVDAVEVVRCKDCMNYNGEGCLKTYGEFEPDPMDFCSHGERKDNG